ncbi:1,4-alpha-glucan branching protein GlgB [Desertivibrio insolitus]|uniref:1,4-alpha-glucan branching protein GlgB n=1 Tax=Herbiconiux sp. SYSU D00978 TaxID=2812562 RepID=UPI001A961CBE|nr:1,4-alpha-glucan branching protein GlgB [Herbiconiux sp. SYSU D00978]
MTDLLPEIDRGWLYAVAEGRHPDPHSLLGQHQVGDGFVIRALRPFARAVRAHRADGSVVELEHVEGGLWQGYYDGPGSAYTLETEWEDGGSWTADDAYRFVPSFGEVDRYLWGQGRHEQLWHVFGSHLRRHEDVEGVAFAVWAPHAQAVRIVGDFNGWNGLGHAMRRLDDVGVWELFIPALAPGTVYKYEILTRDGRWVQRADPVAMYTEVPPKTGSVVSHSQFTWSDSEWLEQRAARDPHNSPMSVYEVHVGSWRPGLSYRELADQLIEYVLETSFTHVEFLPLAEHPFGGSWGYQVTGYYAPTSRFGHPDDLRYLIDRLHNAGIGVIMDWVPGHFPKDEWALANFDGEPVYEHSDPRLGEQLDWGTKVFNFGDSQVRNFLVANALYWLEEFHIDGLRVDAVASMLYLDYSRTEWVPNKYGGRENLEAISFLQEANATAYKRNPGIVMIAEESTAFPGVSKPTSSGGLGFGIKWNMGWMHDSLQYISRDPAYRSYHHNEITFSLVYAFTEQFLLPISHDEVVHGKGSLLGKMPGDQWQKLANLRAYLSFMWGHPGKQLLFMGQEFGQPSEWSEQRGLDWWILDQPVHQGLQRFVGQLNRLYKENPALWEQDNVPAGFEWIDGGDAANNVISFVRWSKEGEAMAIVTNFSGHPISPYRIGLPFAGTWDEVLNSDAQEFGGSGVGNFGQIEALPEPWAGRPASAELTVPPLASLWLKLRRPAEPEQSAERESDEVPTASSEDLSLGLPEQ